MGVFVEVIEVVPRWCLVVFGRTSPRTLSDPMSIRRSVDALLCSRLSAVGMEPSACSVGRGAWIGYEYSIRDVGAGDECQNQEGSRSKPLSSVGRWGFLVHPPLAHPCALRFGAPHLRRGLALPDGHPPNPYLGFETFPGSSGMGWISRSYRIVWADSAGFHRRWLIPVIGLFTGLRVRCQTLIVKFKLW